LDSPYIWRWGLESKIPANSVAHALSDNRQRRENLLPFEAVAPKKWRKKDKNQTDKKTQNLILLRYRLKNIKLNILFNLNNL
jgi:hypothetical protein